MQVISSGPAPDSEVLLLARARLAEAVKEVSALDAEVETLATELAAFAAELEEALGEVDREARRAQAAVRRVQSFAFALAQETARVRQPPTPAKRRRRPRATPARPELPSRSEEPPLLESADEALRRVYRRLARLLHPDLASSDAEHERLTGLMAQVNVAYAAKDLEALNLTAEKLGAGEQPGLVTEADRLSDLSRRHDQLRRVAASLRRELERLRESDTARVREEAERQRAEGSDPFDQGRAELEAETLAARADLVQRLIALDVAAATLTAARKKAMADLEPSGTRSLRRFDPLAESEVVRRTAARLKRTATGASARALSRWLEEAATAAGPEAALTLLAFFAEVGSEVPPPSLATAAGFVDRWEALRAELPDAPELSVAVASLPPHLTVGARAGRQAVVAGVQLAQAELVAGVELALEHPAVAALARTVLALLGPSVRCETCATPVRALHVLATTGLDHRHALVCPSCGGVLQRYWRFGEVEGLEALAPWSLRLGLTAEVGLHLASASVRFGLLPTQREALTARELLERFENLYLEPCQVTLPPGALVVRDGPRALRPRERAGAEGRLQLATTSEAQTTPEALLELLRTRVERRFRPES